MEYRPVTAVWEITMGCNMRCKHCGSSCAAPLEDELTTAEALHLCEDLGEMGLQWITLSGGEPTTRKDWHVIAGGLRDNGVIPNIITNGWLLDETIIEQAIHSGVNTIAISIDGLAETHDFIRKEGSFQRILKAFDFLAQQDQVAVGAITTIHNRNIGELPALREVLIEHGVKGWQVQIGLPMGNMAVNPDLVVLPSIVDEIIDFSYETMKDGRIHIQLADCIGYFNTKEIEIRNHWQESESYLWQGCAAGRFGMGILHNGEITGCTSIRDKRYIAGNIRNTPVKDIWENPASFRWNRELTKRELHGFCRICQYGQVCLGGCANTRLTLTGDIYGENEYCSYNLALKKASRMLGRIRKEELLVKANKFAENNSFQLAEILLSRAMAEGSQDPELLNLYGLVSFRLGNYQEARQATKRVLAQNPTDAYAHKGLGLSLYRLGEVELGIEHLHQAIALADENFMDPYYDLAVILLEQKRPAEARQVLEEGRNRSAEFCETSRLLYEQLSVG